MTKHLWLLWLTGAVLWVVVAAVNLDAGHNGLAAFNALVAAAYLANAHIRRPWR